MHACCLSSHARNVRANACVQASKRAHINMRMTSIAFPQPYDPDAPGAAPPVLRDMVLFTEKSQGKDVWPYGMDWLDTAYSTPYFVTKAQEQQGKAGAGV